MPGVEEPVSETAAGGTDVACVVSDEVGAVVSGDEAACVFSEADRVVADVAEADSIVSDEVRTRAAGADGG